MESSIFSKVLAYIIKEWKTTKGFLASIIFVVPFTLVLLNIKSSAIIIIIVLSTSYFIWFCIWFYKSGRLVFPSDKKTVVLCFDVDWEGIKNYSRVVKKIINSISNLNLRDKIRIKPISPDLIQNKPKAHKYRETKGVELIIWGKTDYGNLNNEKVLFFEVHHTVYISKSLAERLDYFLADLTLILAKKNWQIKEINELEEYKIVASNFLETILFIIGLYFYYDEQLNNSIKIFEYLLPILVDKEKVNKILEFQIQSGRVKTLLIEMYFFYGRILHDTGKNKEALYYLNKIPEHIPNPIPLYIMLARVSYLGGDEQGANNYTEKIRKLNKRHPAVCLNYAFFGIKQKNYDRVKFWYDEFIKHKFLIDIDIMSVITFLDEEYSKDQTELAYLYALGIVNGYIDLIKRKRDLNRFIRLTKNRLEYTILHKRANELIR